MLRGQTPPTVPGEGLKQLHDEQPNEDFLAYRHGTIAEQVHLELRAQVFQNFSNTLAEHDRLVIAAYDLLSKCVVLDLLQELGRRIRMYECLVQVPNKAKLLALKHPVVPVSGPLEKEVSGQHKALEDESRCRIVAMNSSHADGQAKRLCLRLRPCRITEKHELSCVRFF